MKKYYIFLLLIFTSFFIYSCSVLKYYPISFADSVCFIDKYGKKQTDWFLGYSDIYGYEFPTIKTDKNSMEYKYLNPKTEKWISINFLGKGHFSDHIFSNALLSIKDEKLELYGYIDCNGNYVISPMYEYTDPFSNEVAWVCNELGSPYLLINKKNKNLFSSNYKIVTPYKNNYAYVVKQIVPDFYVPYVENGIVVEGAEEQILGSFGGIIDKKGNEIISFTLGEVTEVSDGAVKCKERYISSTGETYSLYGYKNLQDEWIIKPKYKYADNFKYGLAEVSDDGKEFYLIDKNDMAQLRGNYSFIYVLNKNLLILSQNNEDFYLSNLKGDIKSQKFNLIKVIDEDMCLAKIEDEFLYINHKGKFFNFNNYIK